MSSWRTIRVDELPDPKTVEPYSIYKLPDESTWWPDNMEGNGEATKWLAPDEYFQKIAKEHEESVQKLLVYFQINEQVDMTRWNDFVNSGKHFECENIEWKSYVDNYYQLLSGKCFVRKIEEDEACSSGVRITVQNELGHEASVDLMWVEKLS